MTTHAMTLTSPGELLTVVPYLLGFHPEDSLVVVCLRDQHLGLTQRLDMPACGEEARAVGALLPSLAVEDPDAVILIGYETQSGRCQPIVEALTNALVEVGVRIHDRIIVHDNHWRLLDCDNPTCCPPAGKPVPTPAEVSSIVAEFVGHEVAPHTLRGDLVAQLEASDSSGLVAEALTADSSGSKGEAVASWQEILDSTDGALPISVGLAASAVDTLRNVALRDGLVAWLTPGTLPLDQLPVEAQELASRLPEMWGQDGTGPAEVIAQNRVQARLIRLCAMLPDEHATPALTVLACFTWWRGNGALTRVALARALRCQPDYRLAVLLEQMVDLAIRPRRAK